MCKSFIKIGYCENYDQCPLRHPEGICLHWRRGHCEKDSQCFYRHPDEELGTVQNDESRTPDYKRKRTLSNQNGSTENHFLYQKVLELSKVIEDQKLKTASSQQHLYASQMLPENTSRQLPTHFSRQQNIQEHLTRPSEHVNQFPRQNLPMQFPRASVPNQIRHQTPTNPYNTPAGPAQPVLMPSWGLGNTAAQWGPQEFFQGNQPQ